MKSSGLANVKRHWGAQARMHARSPAASWSDTTVIGMEIREITRYLSDGDAVIDIGCANGYSTLHYAAAKKISIKGIDYIPGMVKNARASLRSSGKGLAKRASFEVGNILSLKERPESYDKAIVTRVIINLVSWENQMKALRQCARILKPGGILLLSEATTGGWKRLNIFRKEWGLPPIGIPSHNTYLDEKKVVKSLGNILTLVEIKNFASTYYVGTRVLKPLLMRLPGVQADAANPDMEWNKFFGELPACGEYGVQKLFVFRKPA